jgi:hypothetical protein
MTDIENHAQEKSLYTKAVECLQTIDNFISIPPFILPSADAQMKLILDLAKGITKGASKNQIDLGKELDELTEKTRELLNKHVDWDALVEDFNAEKAGYEIGTLIALGLGKAEEMLEAMGEKAALDALNQDWQD